MGCVQILASNYLDLGLLANTDVTSENPDFPVDNAYNFNRRSKVYRSYGFFKVVDGENTIIFTEGGADLTATVAAGEYTSTATFMAAVDAAFTTAAGASGSYTVTQNSGLKFVITKSAGSFSLKWTDAASADMASMLGFDTDVDRSGLLSYSADIIRIHYPYERIIFDHGLSSNPTHFALIGPRNTPIKISPSAVIKLQGNETNIWDSPSFEQTLTYDDEIICALNAEGLHTEPLRYWSLEITDQTNVNGFVEIGAMYLGSHFAPSRGGVQFPFSASQIDLTETITSEGGQTFSDLREKTESFNLSWLGLTKEDSQEFENIFRRVGTGKPFFMVFDAVAGFSTSVNRKFRYVKFDSEPSYQLVSPNNYVWEFRLREQL